MGTTAPPPIPGGAVAAVVALLDGEQLLSLAVNRADGWPQVTTVGYVNEGLNLYIVVGRTSQKLVNMKADPRVSVAIRSQSLSGDAVGVSMAAKATEITDPARIEAINRMVVARYPDLHVFGPSEDSVAVVHLRPEIISPVAVTHGRSHPRSFSLGASKSEGVAQAGPRSDLDQGGAH